MKECIDQENYDQRSERARLSVAVAVVVAVVVVVVVMEREREGGREWERGLRRRAGG